MDALGNAAGGIGAGLGLACGSAVSGNGSVHAVDAVELLTFTSDNVEPKSVAWLWEDKVALGQVTAVVGKRGAGKSLVALDLAARVSRGARLPDDVETVHGPGSVLVVAPEDDLASVIVPRLIAAGADRGKIHCLRALRNQVRSRRKLRAADLEHWGRIAKEIPDLRLVIVDRLAALLGTANDRRANEVQEFLGQLGDFAETHGVAVLILNADDKVSAGRSGPFGQSVLPFLDAFAGAVWKVEVDPEEPARRWLRPERVDGAADPGTLGFAIGRRSGRVEWVSEAVAPRTQPVRPRVVQTPVDTRAGAVTWLGTFLSAGPRTVDDIVRDGARAGHSPAALSTAGETLNVEDDVSHGQSGGGWSWKLPKRGDGPGEFRGKSPEDSKSSALCAGLSEPLNGALAANRLPAAIAIPGADVPLSIGRLLECGGFAPIGEHACEDPKIPAALAPPGRNRRQRRAAARNDRKRK